MVHAGTCLPPGVCNLGTCQAEGAQGTCPRAYPGHRVRGKPARETASRPHHWRLEEFGRCVLHWEETGLPAAPPDFTPCTFYIYIFIFR